MKEEVIAKKCGMVLDHHLFVEYDKFKKGEGYDKLLVNKILSYYHNDFLTNVGQYDRNGIQINRNYRAALVTSGLKNQSLEELAELTTYKIILTDEKTNFPFVNINEGRFKPSISTFYEGNEERVAAKDYLKKLCQGAKKRILLYDGYINVASDLDGLLKYILPNSKIQFIFSFSKINVDHRNELSRTHPNLRLKDLGGVPKHHDRYLIIDDAIEVVLTSGFEYLQNQSKELSLVIRPIKDMHGLK